MLTSSLLVSTTLFPYLILASFSAGMCEPIQPIMGFNLTNYLGTWYEQYRDVSVPF